MNNSGLQRLIPIALVLIVLVVVVAALISIGRSIFGGSSNEPVTDTAQDALLNTALDRSVRMTVRGPIVADENFHTYTITASPTQRNMTTYEGYLSRQIETKQLTNNSKAYEQFVYALNRAKLTDTRTLDAEQADMRGICASGMVYQFQILQASNVVDTVWTTTCSNAKGSLVPRPQPIVKLFQLQIPEYTELLEPLSNI